MSTNLYSRIAQWSASTTRTAWLQSIGYYVTFIAIGLSAAILGPTLNHLASHTGSAISTISWLFSANAFGRLFGGLLGGRLYDRIPGHPLAFTALLLIALSLTIIPIAPILAILFVMEFVLGLAEGTADVGCNTLLLWVHGDKVGPFMNALHLMFGLGTFLMPFIIVYSLGATQDVQWAYWIVAAVMVPVALFVLRQPSPHAAHPTNTANSASPAPAAAAKHNNPVLIALIALFFYLIVAGEVSIFGWIFNYGKAFDMSDNTAAQLSQVFFGTFTLSRVIAIPIAVRLNPRVILIVNLVICVLACVVMGFGSSQSTFIWLGTALFGLGIAPLFASALAFAEQHITISGRVTGIFLASGNVGIMTAPVLIGQLFESTGPIVVPVVVGLCILAAGVTLSGMVLIANRPTRPSSA